MASSNSAVVASLRERSTHPLSSISLSPSRQFAVIAGKETLQIVKISPEGIHILRSLKISQVCEFIYFILQASSDSPRQHRSFLVCSTFKQMWPNEDRSLENTEM
jgi:hypothetical protein